MTKQLLIGIVCCALVQARVPNLAAADPQSSDLFAKKNLVAWCIVPFDSKKRGPEERAAMLEKLGFTQFAYDYRAEHIPTFDAEIEALKHHHIKLSAWWFPTSLNDEAKMTLAVFEKHKVTPQLWVTGGGGPTSSAQEQEQRVRDEAARIRPIAEAAAKVGCQVALYNHGGWFGEPENQIAIIRELKLSNVGIVYNLHHGHDHLDRFSELLQKMKPYLYTLNLNGMVKDGERKGQKILQLGEGNLDLSLLKTIRHSGYTGPIGILGHTSDDAEERLRDNLDGLEWLRPQLDGKPAGPKPKPRTPVPVAQAAAPTAPPANVSRLAEGRFGKAMDGRAGGAFVTGRDEFRQFPITVECWTKLTDKAPYNILIANDLKSSGTHWELFSMAGSGHFTVYTPGFAPDHCHSKAMICDGQWHHVAMILEPERIRLFVDGQLVSEQAHHRTEMKSVPGNLGLASLVDQQFGCTGLLDEVRISRKVRSVTTAPVQPFVVDEATLGLWHLDGLVDQKTFEDATKKSPAVVKLAAAPHASDVRRPKIEGHWGEDALGFRWTEEDSRDDRFGQMDTGPFFSGSITGPGGIVYKGIVVRLGDKRTASICYDTELMRASAGWKGFLRFDAARFGIIVPPKIEGQVAFTTPLLAGWSRTDQFFNFRETSQYGMLPKSMAHYEGLHRHGQRVVLTFTVGSELAAGDAVKTLIPSTTILESPWIEGEGDEIVLSRTIQIGPSTTPLSMLVAGGATHAVLLPGQHQSELKKGLNNNHVLVVPARTEPVTVKLLVAATAVDKKRFAELTASSPPAEDLVSLIKPGPAIWGDPLETVGEVSKSQSPFAIDTITLPFENRFKALMFCGGHDMLPDGKAFVCTLHGDVWLVSGIDATLGKITWRRFATGLFQPLGVKLVPRQAKGNSQAPLMDLYVVGRDQITRLHDENGDGEADFYENFNNDAYVSLNGHEYVTCLETDRAGNFYYMKGNCNSAIPHDGSLLRVTADGSKLEVFATGFRNANGIGIGPNDEITVAPQEGEWTPASAVYSVHQGGFYGGMMSHHQPTAPTDFERPFCWFPRLADNSCGGQVWVPSAHWGPLANQLLHLSYGQCKLRLLLQEQLPTDEKHAPFTSLASRRSPFVTLNGGSTEFPMTFASGIHRARFSPYDGNLYLTGLKGWVTSAVNDGCFQRVRYTGEPVDLLIRMKTYHNGVALTFARDLDRSQVEHIDNYQIEAWNYHWSAAYGSPDLRPSAPGQVGRDAIEPKSVSLLSDNRTVFIELPDLKPVDQLGVTYNLTSSAGTAFEQTAYLTINAVPVDAMPESQLHRSTADVERLALLSRLAPGLQRSNGTSLAPTVLRNAAWPAGIPGQYASETHVTGFLKVPFTGDYFLRTASERQATVEIGGTRFELGKEPTKARLVKGLNKLRIRQPGTENGFLFRLMWQSDRFPLESIPSSLLFHEKNDNDASQHANAVQTGRALIADRKCGHCHESRQVAELSHGMEFEKLRQAPRLHGIGTRANPDWLAAWLRDPAHLRPNATMPSNPALQNESTLADLVAFLLSLGEGGERPSESVGGVATSNQGGDSQFEAGAALFERLGCIACHTFAPSDVNPEWNRVSLHFIAAKYRGGQLEQFLREPHRHHPGSHMPDFHLTDNELVPLAVYLNRSAKGSVKPFSAAAGNAERGKKAFVELRCDRCHQVNSTDKLGSADVRAAFTDDVRRGCLAKDSDSPRRSLVFSLTDAERSALAAYLNAVKSGDKQLGQTMHAELSHTMSSLRCSACHSRDGSSSAWPEIVSEEGSGKLTEIVPQLTWVGEKLQGPWIEKLLKGQLEQKPRPWLAARMPSFPAYADLISHAMDEHGVMFAEPALHDLDPDRIEVGRRLTLLEGGLDCRQCHGLGKEQPRGDTKTQIALGINFALTRERLRPEFALCQMLDPPRYDISSRMPRFAPDLKTTAAKHIEGGDARKQFEAIKQYLWSLKSDE